MKYRVAYVCVHNSCRSQMAEALTNRYFSDFFIASSGGTETKNQMNQDAVRLMKQVHHIDMEENQFSKLVDTLSEIDILITMGCNVNCPYVPCKYREDWGLDDPSGKSDDFFLETMTLIYQKIESLKTRIQSKEIHF